MKKLFLGFAALAIASGTPGIAQAMECCKDGSCECCKKDETTVEPAPEGAHQH